MQNKKRIFLIAGIHFVVAVIVFILAIIYTVKSIDSYPQYAHPLILRIIQPIIYFPFTLLITHSTIFIIKTYSVPINVYTMVIISAISLPINSVIWGIAVNKLYCLMKKET